MRTVHLLAILLALTAGNAAAVPLQTSVKERLTGKFFLSKIYTLCVLTLTTTSLALTHTPERVGFFGRTSVFPP